jgi:integrase
MTEKRYRTSNDALSREQVRTLLNGIYVARDKMMITLGIFSGCRVNELTHLRLDKIDWAQDSIIVWDDKKNQWSWKRNEQGKKVRDIKLTEGRWRKIAIPHDVMLQLKAYIDQNPSKTEYVWNLSWVTWNRIIHTWSLRLLKINKSWHSLRHTFITLHQTAGSPIGFVKAQTGDTAATLLRVYDNPSPDMIRENAEKRLF